MYFNPSLFMTNESTKLFVSAGINVFASRFSDFYCKWQPVKKLFWNIYIKDGQLLLDTYSAFWHIN